MNIVHLLSQNHLTGAEVYAATLATEQIQQSNQVFQISNGFFYPTKATSFPLEVETKSRLRFLKNIFWFRRFLKENNIEVIHTHSRASAKLAYWARLGLPTALVSTIHGRQHPSFSKKLHNQYGEFLISICENVKRQLIQDFSYSENKIKNVRNPIDENKFKFYPRKNNQAKIKLAIIGRTTGPKKDRTEQVIASLPSHYSITLVGGKISDLNLSQKDLSRIFEIDTPQLTSANYADYDLVIGSGRVCIEALITGVPTIAFGEAKYVGLVTLSNYELALESNFGDIDPISIFPKLNTEQFIIDLKNFDTVSCEALSNKANKDFALKNITKKINRLYESALFIRRFSKWIPILMYHKIPKSEISSAHRTFVIKENFEKHLQFFKRSGFTTLTFNDLEKYRKNLIPFEKFPKKPLILTFDDGYKDNLQNASELLKKYNFKAQIFLLADSNVNTNHWDHSENEPAHDIISGEDRKLWLSSPFEIGSHGFSHKKITNMTTEEALVELSKSKDSLEKEFSTNVNTFAFTYGITNPKAANLAEEAGYSYALNTDTGGFLLEENPFEIFRVNIFPEESNFSLWKKTSSWYRKYYFFKRKK